MNVAAVQMPMGWNLEVNVAAILQCLDDAKRQGADVAVFPECAVTGFHYKMGEGISRESVRTALRKIGNHCAARKISAIMGSPYYDCISQKKPWNAVVVFDDTGQVIAAYPKIMFTSGETNHDIFEPGNLSTRSCFRLGGFSCAVLICCEWAGEGEQRDGNYREILSLLGEAPEIIFVPGIFGIDDTTIQRVQDFARDVSAYIILANWPEWGGPDVSEVAPGKCLGRSLTVSPTGKCLSEGPANQVGIITATILPQKTQTAKR